MKNLATLSDGTVIENPRYLRKSERKLKKAQQALGRKTKDSNRRAKAKATVARIHARVANQRQDAMHKLTTWLTNKYSDISVEDLHVAGMVKNRHLANPNFRRGFRRVPPTVGIQDGQDRRGTARRGPLARK